MKTCLLIMMFSLAMIANSDAMPPHKRLAKKYLPQFCTDLSLCSRETGKFRIKCQTFADQYNGNRKNMSYPEIWAKGAKAYCVECQASLCDDFISNTHLGG